MIMYLFYDTVIALTKFYRFRTGHIASARDFIKLVIRQSRDLFIYFIVHSVPLSFYLAQGILLNSKCFYFLFQ